VNDQLPYSTKKLLAPEELKKSGGSWCGNASAGGAQAASGSKNSTVGSVSAGRGRSRGGSSGQRQGKEQEVSSPSKGGQGTGRGGGRASRGRGRGRSTVPGRELFPTNTPGKPTSGLKCKAAKAQGVQLPSTPVVEETVDNSRAVVVSEHGGKNPEVDEDSLSTDSVKKQRLTTSRSADQAAAAEQPRQTQ
jgi:hypothetical protein